MRSRNPLRLKDSMTFEYSYSCNMESLSSFNHYSIHQTNHHSSNILLPSHRSNPYSDHPCEITQISLVK